MKVKFGILSLALSVGAVTLFADDNTKGIDFYRAGMLDEAKTVLLANLQNDKVDKAETCYYLGEVYSDLNMKDSAAYYYKEGLVADPDYVFNSIGELKLGLKENPNQDSAFDGFFTGKNKKNPLIYIAVARAYLPVSIDKAKEYMEKPGAVPISLSLPFSDSAFSPVRTKNFFEGLLPEGFTRRCFRCCTVRI